MEIGFLDSKAILSLCCYLQMLYYCKWFKVIINININFKCFYKAFVEKTYIESGIELLLPYSDARYLVHFGDINIFSSYFLCIYIFQHVPFLAKLHIFLTFHVCFWWKISVQICWKASNILDPASTLCCFENYMPDQFVDCFSFKPHIKFQATDKFLLECRVKNF